MSTFFKSLSTFCIVVFATCLNISCTHNSGNTIDCMNGGIYKNGTCTCAVGYQGTNCQTLSRKAFLGNWTVFEKGSVADAAQYAVGIQTAGPNINDIAIANLIPTIDTTINGYIVNDSLYIPYQVLQNQSIQGTGYYFQLGRSDAINIAISYDLTNLTTNVSTFVTDTLL